MANKTIRILVAEDHQMVRQGLCKMLSLETDYEVCRECDDGIDALEAIRELEPDIALLDHALPRITGLAIVKELYPEKRPTRLIMLSSYRQPMLIAEALRHGVAAYVIKDEAFEELDTAIRKAMDGKLYLSGGIGQDELREALHQLPLSKRELEVLQGILQGLSAKMIADRLSIGVRTVESYRNNLIQKFSVETSLSLVRKAIESGLGI
ncbi:response regulator transcription factor [Rubellicoccus peritrichatus]|uniref:Response regulator transcription factor n=1 Tax=Rubellicoccus peritrichatus TaxID=3080537 RepID=A0AAQ3QTH3_9BACT|nr:response regulator transcription factor [Puniceicoccus sp. CR14]WOO39378.1 response regulator transcription factor [Puniceicoccus sp. CR14]